MEVTDGAIHNIDKLIDDLKNLKCTECSFRLKISQEECPNFVQILDSVAEVSKTPTEETTKVVINKALLMLLGHKSKRIVVETTKDIVEIARTDWGREKCTTIELIRALNDLLQEDDIDILTQACRALGHICHNKENGKNLMREQVGLKVILTVLKKGIALDNFEDSRCLLIAATGLLYIYLEGQKALYMKALKEDMLPIICSILEQNGFRKGPEVVNVVLTLNMFTKENIVFLDERLTKVLVDIIIDISLNKLPMWWLEMFLVHAKDENAKLLLARARVCEFLLKLLEKHDPQCNDENMRSKLERVRNLIILILTGDARNLLYGSGDGPVYRKLAEWLNSSNIELWTTAVVGMQEFARTRTHHKRMFEDGIYQKIVELLETTDGESINHTCKSILNRMSVQNCFLKRKYRPMG